MTAGVRQGGTTGDRLVSALALLPLCAVRSSIPGSIRRQAGAAAARTTGFSTIGRFITAESTPNSTESHHTAS